MVEKQIKIIIFVVDSYPFLPGNKGKARANFKKKLFKFSEDCGFEVPLAVCIRQTKEIEYVGITQDKIRGQPVFLPQNRKFMFNELLRFFGNSCALVKHAFYLLLEDTGTPSFDPAHLSIEVTFKRIFNVNNFP